jgi:Icc-related predicted phosphoesterase
MPTICIISDTHGKHRDLVLPKADWIIHAGDVSSLGTIPQISDFLEWYANTDYEKRFLISGNHDFLYERQPELAKGMIPENVTYLESSSVEVDGIKIYGEPRTPWFHNWAFNVHRGDSIKKYWDAIPDDTNILITHGPPKGILDMTIEGEFVGCQDLTIRLQSLKDIKLVCCGHIHEGRGYYEYADGQLIINASVLNRSYKLVNKPYVVDTDTWKIISS